MFISNGKHLAEAINPSISSHNHLSYSGEPSLDDFKLEPVSEDTIKKTFCIFFEKFMLWLWRGAYRSL